MEQQLTIIEAQIRECFARIVWTHKIHEKCADIALKSNNKIKIIEIVLSATTTTTLLVSVFGETKVGTIIGAILSTILLGLTTYTKDYDLGEIAQKHINAASKLWNVRETYLSLITDIKLGSVDIEDIKRKRDELQNEIANIYIGSPRTNSKSYEEARKALKMNEEFTFSDKEIDLFLPRELRKITE